MVILCNTNIISVDQFKKNEAAEKNGILDIYVKMKYGQKDEQKQVLCNDIKFEGTITRTSENYSAFSNKSKQYDYEEKKRAYNTTMFDPNRKYSDK